LVKRLKRKRKSFFGWKDENEKTEDWMRWRWMNVWSVYIGTVDKLLLVELDSARIDDVDVSFWRDICAIFIFKF
jgi:hypothetical protein